MTWYVEESKTTELLQKLAQDADLLAAFKQDPHAVMERAGLSMQEQAALMSKDKSQLFATYTERLNQVSDYASA
ncbi:MAG TPA: hypothetical protein VLL52_16090 [Anaerolineae bacterium]|nr:hypothetical protein [Anaerolineae bacterium]